MKVLLILVDGMRSDALKNVKAAQDIIQKSSYTMNARTVMPSVTLPCHMSLFHSVDPSRHGTTTNLYAPQVRPVKGLCEVLAEHHKKSAFFYSWEELRDLSRPNSLSFSYFCKSRDVGYDKVNDTVSLAAIDFLTSHDIDFAFLYLEYPDAAGHKNGWMSDAYQEAVENSWQNIARVMNSLPKDYTVIITSDHGGHDRIHGTDFPEDMTIPVILHGEGFEAGRILENVSIKDLAPTIVKLLGAEADGEWEGVAINP